MRPSLITLAAIALSSASALALEAKVEKAIATDAAATWAAIGDFCGISKWHPVVTKCQISEKDGKTFRTLTLKDGATLLEQLVSFDKAGMSYTYTIVEGPLPVKNYTSTIAVKPAGSASTVTWAGTFEANGAADADAIKTITGVYEAGTGELAKAK